MYYKKIDIDDETIDKLPQPKGYKILVACPGVDDKTSGGIFLHETTKMKESTASIIGYVLEMGSDAYRDTDKFPSGSYCKPGDTIIFRSYSGTRFKFQGSEFRLINDDTVEAVVADPTGLERA
jgi:co-chaperonin GroES (HSP10)